MADQHWIVTVAGGAAGYHAVDADSAEAACKQVATKMYPNIPVDWNKWANDTLYVYNDAGQLMSSLTAEIA